MAPALLRFAHTMKLAVGLAIAVAFAGPIVASARSVGDRCPAYAGHLVRARNSLSAGDRDAAIAALRDAQQALGECLKRECDEAGEQVMLAAASPPGARAGTPSGQSFCSDWRSTRSTSAGSTFLPASS